MAAVIMPDALPLPYSKTPWVQMVQMESHGTTPLFAAEKTEARKGPRAFPRSPGI